MASAAFAAELMSARVFSSGNGRPPVASAPRSKHQLVAFAIEQDAPVPRGALCGGTLRADARRAVGRRGVVPAPMRVKFIQGGSMPCAGRDEASVATHEFHETDAAGHAARLGMRAIEHPRGFFDGAEESECARDEANVVVDGLRYTDDGERVAAAARFLVEIVRAALRAVATDSEENVNAARDKVVDRDAGSYRAARGAEDGASFLMNAIDELRRDLHRFGTFCGIEPAVTAAKAKHLSDTVAVVQFEKERADDVVETGAQAATRHNARARLFRVEEKFRARAGQLELKARFSTDFDPLGDTEVVADRVATCGGEAWLAESRGVHRKRAMVASCGVRRATSSVKRRALQLSPRRSRLRRKSQNFC